MRAYRVNGRSSSYAYIRMTQHIVQDSDSDIRLDRWFKRHFPELTHGLLEKALRKGEIRVDSKKAKASDRVQVNQVIDVRIQMPAARETFKPIAYNMISEDVQMIQDAILYKDADVIVINKPPGLAVQGGSKVLKSVDGMLDVLRFEAKERPKLVHRLDRDTSGVLVLARSAKVATKLMRIFSAKEAEKFYWALVKGVPETLQGKIDMPLAKQEDGDIEKVQIDEQDGKRAITFYEVKERLSKTLAWVELQPVTGRMHQLRVHMAAIGHPILGDGKYGGRDSFLDGMEISRKLHLHARRIIIPGMLDVTAPMPKHMEESWKKLGLDLV
jgi:23S rRNA pseudouridine955/2504/2580 synthase